MAATAIAVCVRLIRVTRDDDFNHANTTVKPPRKGFKKDFPDASPDMRKRPENRHARYPTTRAPLG